MIMLNGKDLEFIRDSVDLEMVALEEDIKQTGQGFERYERLEDVRNKLKKIQKKEAKKDDTL